jgi:hypothetical protein
LWNTLKAELAGAFEVKVYSLKAHCWTSVKDEGPYWPSRISSGPVFVNGALYWVVKNVTRQGKILEFHLTTEKFRECGLPVDCIRLKL